VPGKRDAIPNAEVVPDDRRPPQALGITPRKISDEEIVQRLVFSLVNEGRAHSGRRHCQQGQRHRHGLHLWLWLPGAPWRPAELRQRGGLFNVVQAMKRFAQNPLDDAKLLAARAAAGPPGRRRQDVLNYGLYRFIALISGSSYQNRNSTP
jgi:3-hydroxyacyl-CoA dehydrogenase